MTKRDEKEMQLEESHANMVKKPAESEEAFAYLKKIYEDLMPFDRLLGVRVVSLDFDDVCVRVDMKP